MQPDARHLYQQCLFRHNKWLCATDTNLCSFLFAKAEFTTQSLRNTGMVMSHLTCLNTIAVMPMRGISCCAADSGRASRCTHCAGTSLALRRPLTADHNT